MADALCGPSNALQRFQKHTSVDRTLQQDRITASRTQVESFRSLPGPNTGILDAEFEAFQAGAPLVEPGYSEPQRFSHAAPRTLYQPNFQQSQPVPSDWVSDFQNLDLNEARGSPIPPYQVHHHAPLQRHMPAGWHQDFLRQQSQPSLYQPQRQQMPVASWSYVHTGGLMPQQDTMLSSIGQQKQPEMQAEDMYDEAAFERAFDAAGLNNEQSHYRTDERDTQLDQDLYRTEDAGKNLMSPETEAWLDHRRLGSDRILDEELERQSQNKEATDADDLARTAGQLLENVKGDQSQKFQESNFLSLMRQLRDKEVQLEGDRLVDVTQDLHPGGENYPNEPAIKPANTQHVPDPDNHSVLEAADDSYGMPMSSDLNNPDLLENFDFEEYLSGMGGGDFQFDPSNFERNGDVL